MAGLCSRAEGDPSAGSRNILRSGFQEGSKQRLSMASKTNKSNGQYRHAFFMTGAEKIVEKGLSPVPLGVYVRPAHLTCDE